MADFNLYLTTRDDEWDFKIYVTNFRTSKCGDIDYEIEMIDIPFRNKGKEVLVTLSDDLAKHFSDENCDYWMDDIIEKGQKIERENYYDMLYDRYEEQKEATKYAEGCK